MSSAEIENNVDLSSADEAPPSPVLAKAPRRAVKKKPAAANKRKASGTRVPSTPVAATEDAGSGAEEDEVEQTTTKRKTKTVPKKRAAASRKKADADADGETAPKKRAPRPRKTYIEGYGDEESDADQRGYTREDYELWKQRTQERLDGQSYTSWVAQKRGFYTKQKRAAKQSRKRKQKTVDEVATSNRYLDRLKAMDAEDFAGLEGKWLSMYGFDKAHTAEDLDGIKAVKGVFQSPEKGAQSAFTVYRAAVYHGVQPAGIVPEHAKRNDAGELEFKVKIDGERVYVGGQLPFQGKEGSPFACIPDDRVFCEEADLGTAPVENASPKKKAAPKKKAPAKKKAVPEPEDDDGTELEDEPEGDE